MPDYQKLLSSILTKYADDGSSRLLEESEITKIKWNSLLVDNNI